MKIAYLGSGGHLHRRRPARGGGGRGFEPLRTATVHDAILAVERGEAERALVPFENSIEGSVRSTLDTLAFEAPEVTIVGEHDYAVRAHLIAREGVGLERGRGGPLPPPAARPVRPLPARAPAGGGTAGVSSTAEAVRTVGESSEPWAAIGARAAAELYGGDVLAEGIEDEPTNVTRFVWIAAAGTAAERGAASGRPRWSSQSSARTIRAPSSTRCGSSPAATST